MTTPKAGVADTVSAVNGDPDSADLEAGIAAEAATNPFKMQAVSRLRRQYGWSEPTASLYVDLLGFGGSAP